MDDGDDIVVIGDGEVSPYLTRAEAAAYLRQSPRTLSRLPIPRKRVGREWLYRRDHLDAWMAEGLETPALPKKRTYYPAPRRAAVVPTLDEFMGSRGSRR